MEKEETSLKLDNFEALSRLVNYNAKPEELNKLLREEFISSEVHIAETVNCVFQISVYLSGKPSKIPGLKTNRLLRVILNDREEGETEGERFKLLPLGGRTKYEYL